MVQIQIPVSTNTFQKCKSQFLKHESHTLLQIIKLNNLLYMQMVFVTSRR